MKLIKNNGKEFRGNAEVFTMNGVTYLRSYQTIVAVIKNGKFYRTWKGYSVSTLRHVWMFVNQFKPEMPSNAGFKTGKAYWLSMPVHSIYFLG